MSFASNDPKPLTQEQIDVIITQLPPPDIELTPEQIATIAEQITPVDISGKVDKVTNKSLVLDTEISKIHSAGSDNQDLSGLEPKVTNKHLSTNDYTTAEQTKLTGIATNATVGADWNTNVANKPSIPSALSALTDDATHRLTTDTEKSTWNGKGSSNLILGDLAANAYPGDKGKTGYDHSQVAHAPAGAEVNVNADWNSASGDSQIMNKPSIPAAQVQSDWNAGSGMGQILNKPSIPAAQVQTDWNASAGMGVLLNKPTISGSNTGDTSGHSALATLDNPTFTTKISTPAITLNTIVLTSTGAELNLLHGITTLSGSNTGDETGARVATIHHAANIKSALLDADEITGQDSAATFGLIRTTWTSVKAFLKTYFDTLYNPIRLFKNLTAAVSSVNTTEFILLQLAIPAARAVSGSMFKMVILGNSSSTGTLIFKVRAGAAGTISDPVAWTATTSTGQVQYARAGFDAISIVRSATTLYTDGIAYAAALQLPTVVAIPATSAIVISGIWYISLTVICSVGTFTAQVGSIEEIR
jgi:hypothetical protein